MSSSQDRHCQKALSGQDKWVSVHASRDCEVALLWIRIHFCDSYRPASTRITRLYGRRKSEIERILSSDTLTSDVDGDQGDPEVPADQHGVCGHGHCHHGASFAGGIHKEQVPLASVILAAPPVAASVSDVSTRLKRPPRD